MAATEIEQQVEHMTKSHLRNVQQLAVFYTGSKDIYAINISKIKAFIIADEVEINDTPADTDVVAGIATIRDEPVLIADLDRWLGKEPLPRDQYKIIIYCEFNNVKIGFLVRDVIDIIEKTTDELNNTEEKNPKVTYVTEVVVANKRKLCTVFNAEKLLKDIGWVADDGNEVDKYVSGKIRSKKYVLVAEDSSVSREIIDNFLSKTGVKYEIEQNGAKLLRRIDEIGVENIGMIITDIEMPEKDGFQVVTTIRETSEWMHLPIVINSSMTSASIVAKMASVGADEFVGKTDVKTLYELVKKYMVEEKDHRDNINPQD
jgi:two-component system chemotaxis response regulator CheV